MSLLFTTRKVSGGPSSFQVARGDESWKKTSEEWSEIGAIVGFHSGPNYFRKNWSGRGKSEPTSNPPQSEDGVYLGEGKLLEAKQNGTFLAEKGRENCLRRLRAKLVFEETLRETGFS